MDISARVQQKFKLVSTLSLIAVVFIHGKFIMSRWDFCMDTNTWMGRVSDIVQFSISEQICRLAVPLFFLISGFFMTYHNYGSFKQYKIKINSRIRSLLVPYLLFSTTWLVVMVSTGRTNLNSIWDFLHYVFVSPVSFQFWFLQHLMVLALVSMLFYHLIKRFDIWVMVALGVIYLLDHDLRTGFGGSLFYYSMGIFLSQKPFHIKYPIFGILFLLLFVLLATMRFINFNLNYNIYCIASKVMIFLGVCGIISWIFEERIPLNPFQWQTMRADTRFFIFCTHEPLLSLLKNIYLQYFHVQYIILLGYFVLPVVTILLCLTVDYYLHKNHITEKLYKVLTGGR